MTLFGFSDYYNIHKQEILQTKSKLHVNEGQRGNASGQRSDESYVQRSTIFELKLKEIFWTEKEIAKVLPRIIKRSENSYLTSLLKTYQSVVKEHMYELKGVFEFLDLKMSGKKSSEINQLLRSLDDLVQNAETRQERDDIVISAISKIQNHKVASYAAIHQFTHKLGSTKNTAILEKIIGDEKTIEFKLNKNNTSI